MTPNLDTPANSDPTPHGGIPIHGGRHHPRPQSVTVAELRERFPVDRRYLPTARHAATPAAWLFRKAVQ